MELIERVPYEATASRPAWAQLPRQVRELVQEREGGRVAHASLAGAGFTRGFAGVLTFDDDHRAFVKAASDDLPVAPRSYLAEAQVLPHLPAGVPAPQLRWVEQLDGWVVLALEAVPGARLPVLPWQPDELTRAVAMCESVAESLTPAPVGLALEPLLPDPPDAPAGHWFGRVADGSVSTGLLSPWARAHLPALDALVEMSGRAVAGSTACHGDLRPDNIVVGADGRMWICDWNWLARGAAWSDLVGLLLTAHADGLDAQGLWQASRLSAGVDDEAVDAWLAWIGAFMLSLADVSPHPDAWLTKHRRWFGTAALAWLEARAGRPSSRRTR